MSIRQRILNLERMVGKTVSIGISHEAIHAAMGRVLTNPVAHEAASKVGTTLIDFGVISDPKAFRCLLGDDDRLRDELLYLTNALADVRYTDRRPYTVTTMIELAPIPTAERLTHQHTGELRTPYDRIAEALGQPHWRDDAGFPGDPAHSRVTWRVRDRRTGAVLVIWDFDADAPTPALTTVWRVAWTDGPDHPGSGRRMLDDTVGEQAGGLVVVE